MQPSQMYLFVWYKKAGLISTVHKRQSEPPHGLNSQAIKFGSLKYGLMLPRFVLSIFHTKAVYSNAAIKKQTRIPTRTDT